MPVLPGSQPPWPGSRIMVLPLMGKAEKAGRTYTTVTPLDREGRLRELARLYGGDKVTETTLRAAAEQLAAAEDFKKSGK